MVVILVESASMGNRTGHRQQNEDDKIDRALPRATTPNRVAPGCSKAIAKRVATTPRKPMTNPRKWFLASACALALSIWPFVTALAQSYPVKPVRSIVGFPPGGAVDFNARLIGQKLSELWGQQVVIENRGGAGSTIGTALAAQAAPDGYTYLVASPAHAINATLYKKLPYDTAKAFTPVIELVSSPLVLYAHPSLPANSLKELIALAKEKPGTLNFGYGGSGTSVHLAGVLFNLTAGTNITNIAYQGGGPALVGLLAGDVQLGFGGIELMSHVKAGKLKALAVTTAKRSPSFPELPTVAESGLGGYDVEAWYGVYVPAGTPPAVVRKLNEDMARVLQTPQMKETYSKAGFAIVASTPEQFAEFTKAEIDKWKKVVEVANVVIE
jgi:tripartite-type tricarboxylate transporter receptor subunit TctC